MKTKIRIIQSNWNNSYGKEYKHLYFDFLAIKYSDELEKYFTLSWQTDKENMRWYAFKCKVESEQISHLAYALKIMKLLDKNCNVNFSTQPKEVIAILKPELYSYKDEFLPITLNGCNSYKVLYNNNQWWTTIYAINETDAYKQAEKFRDKLDNFEGIELHQENILLSTDPVEVTE